MRFRSRNYERLSKEKCFDGLKESFAFDMLRIFLKSVKKLYFRFNWKLYALKLNAKKQLIASMHEWVDSC